MTSSIFAQRKILKHNLAFITILLKSTNKMFICDKSGGILIYKAAFSFLLKLLVQPRISPITIFLTLLLIFIVTSGK